MNKDSNAKNIEKMATCLCEIEEFAASALAHRPATSGEDLLHLSKALEDIRAKLSPPARPLDAIQANPPFSMEPTGFAKFLAMPKLGTQFTRHTSKEGTVFVASWRNQYTSHVYEIHIKRDGASANCGWRATATNDQHLVFSLASKNRTTCERCAVSAMKQYLKRSHRKTLRTIRKNQEAQESEVAK
jgi:hypothetical protein